MFVVSPWRRIWFCCFVTAVVVDASIAARADEAIGVASSVRNNVSGSLPTGDVQINVGENVIRNEIVKTAAESWTKLVFSDSTNLSVGPNATVRLSNFVSSGPSSYGKATIDIAKGAFRFATGHSEKRAYEINSRSRHHRRSGNGVRRQFRDRQHEASRREWGGVGSHFERQGMRGHGGAIG